MSPARQGMMNYTQGSTWGLKMSYEPEGEQISEKKLPEKPKKRPNANTNNPKYANPQTDNNSLTGSGGSRVRTHDKDWDE
jgi:hypothetical protein